MSGRPLHRADVATARGSFHVRDTGPDEGATATLLCVHGNCSSSAFFTDLLAALPADVRGVAVDLRGFGDSDPLPIDATRGLRDLADDVTAVVDALGLAAAGAPPLTALGHSAGAGVVLRLAIDDATRFAGLVLEAPMSPYGFGGTRDLAGTPTAPDHAGSGGGTANPAFVAAIAAGDRSDDPGSPRGVLRAFYVADPTTIAAGEEALLDSVLSTRTGDDHYPGDTTTSEHWPGVAPGTRGMNNAISPRYLDLSGFAAVTPQPPVLWVRGALDAIVSDTSALDLARLGELGAVPGWPGRDVCPPQPMVGQTRAVLDAYATRGGAYREVVLDGVGHSPHLERPQEVLALVVDAVRATLPAAPTGAAAGDPGPALDEEMAR
ncbi:serine aminopeptidase S33 family [Isoptericola jiangsuensis]|uniref:Serine aminopeptidase S33 family n=1 Tax=Isoptericola jiangsuensis TaxID=548579 RepID=A0A2A9EW99_9MICO|nr:alpha/beta fold hydrolase [Isoptericola jiangsuensis]PFG42439.1 serine aminopeptidase S33 family [Isoptericola jiangsuensis]